MELKSSPLKILTNGEYRSKERLIMNIIDYLNVHKEEFENSSFWKKNAHFLLIFYLHDREKDLLDYLITKHCFWLNACYIKNEIYLK